jgi:hypothetical protein
VVFCREVRDNFKVLRPLRLPARLRTGTIDEASAESRTATSASTEG